MSFTEASSKITSIKFINKKTLAASSLDGNVRVYDLVKYKCFREISPEIPNQLMCMDVEKEGECIFAGGFDPFNVYVWSYRTGKLIDVVEGQEGPISHIIFSNNYQNLITGCWDKKVRVTKIFA